MHLCIRENSLLIFNAIIDSWLILHYETAQMEVKCSLLQNQNGTMYVRFPSPLLQAENVELMSLMSPSFVLLTFSHLSLCINAYEKNHLYTLIDPILHPLLGAIRCFYSSLCHLFESCGQIGWFDRG